jgi:hypothetical protein
MSAEPTKGIDMADATVLIYTGAMGHPYVVTAAGDVGRRCHGECNDQATAIEWAREAKEGRAFRRVRGGYKQVFPKVRP